MLFENLQRLYSSTNLTGLNLLTLESCPRPSNPLGHSRSRSWCESMNWCTVARNKAHADIVHRYQMLATMMENEKDDEESPPAPTTSSSVCEPVPGSSNSEDLVIGETKTSLRDKEPVASVEKTSLDQPVSHGKRKSHTVFVGNISFKITQKGLKEFFTKFGRVNKVCLVQDHVKKISKGIAFVTFAKEAAATKAKNASSEELTLDNRIMRVFPARDKRMKLIKDSEEEAQQLNEIDDYKLQTEYTKEDDHISVLDDDSLILIFSYVGEKDLIEVGHVCKRWKTLASRCWASKKSLRFASYFQGFGGSEPTIEMFHEIISQCGNLKELDLLSVPRVDYKSIELIVNFCPHLETIKMTSGDLTNTGIREMAEKCAKLKVVILNRCLQFGEKGLWWLLNLNQNLRVLDITGNRRITGKCFHHISPELRSLTIVECNKIDKYGFEMIGQRCKLLTELNLNGCCSLSSAGLLDVCLGCQELRKLVLTALFPNLSSAGIAHISHLKRLEELYLNNNNSVNNDALREIASGCHELQVLDISACGPSIYHEGMRSLASCKKLKKLNASYLDSFSDETLRALATLDVLQEVRCRGSLSVSVEGCQELLEHCWQLQSLDLSGCEMVGTGILKVALEAAQKRRTGPLLTITIGGTGVDTAEVSNFRHPLLKIETINFCEGRYSDERYGSLDASNYTDDDDDDDEEEDGHIDDFLACDDPQEEFERNWIS